MKDRKIARILSFDGGGVHALSYLPILEDLEAYLGVPVASSGQVDLLAGTSTGAIVATGLKLGIPASSISEFYLDYAERIFKKENVVNRLFHKYSSRNLHGVIDTLLAQHGLRDSRWVDICDQGNKRSKPELIVTLWNVTHGRMSYLSTNLDRPNVETSLAHAKISDIICACCAAPYYFPPRAFKTASSAETVYCDGGITGLNNPSVFATSLLALDRAIKNRSIHVLSCGTGQSTEETGVESVRRWTAVESGLNTIGALMNSSADLMHGFYERFGPSMGVDCYFRTNQARAVDEHLDSTNLLDRLYDNLENGNLRVSYYKRRPRRRPLTGDQEVLDTSRLEEIWLKELRFVPSGNGTKPPSRKQDSRAVLKSREIKVSWSRRPELVVAFLLALTVVLGGFVGTFYFHRLSESERQAKEDETKAKRIAVAAEQEAVAAQRNELGARIAILANQAGQESDALFAAIRAASAFTDRGEAVPANIVVALNEALRTSSERRKVFDFGSEPLVRASISRDGTLAAGVNRFRHMALGADLMQGWSEPLDTYRPMHKSDPIVEMKLAPDRKTLLTVLKRGLASVWQLDRDRKPVDLRYSNLRYAPRYPDQIPERKLSYSPSGGFLADWHSQPPNLSLWSRRGGLLISFTPLKPVQWAQFRAHHVSAEGTAASRPPGLADRMVVVYLDGTAELWELFRENNRIAGRVHKRVKQNGERFVAAALQNKGEIIALKASDSRMKFWDVRSGQLITAETGVGDVIRFSQDDTMLASNIRDDAIGIFRVSDGKLLGELRSHGGTILDLGFSSDDQRVLAVTVDGNVRSYSIDRINTGGQLGIAQHEVIKLAFSPTGNKLAALHKNGAVVIREGNGGNPIHLPHAGDQSSETIEISPEGNLLAVGRRAGVISIIDMETGGQTARFADPKADVREPTRAIAFSPDGKRVAVSAWRQRIWNLGNRTGEPLRLQNRNVGPVYDIKFGPAGKHLILGGSNHIEIADTDTGMTLIPDRARGTSDHADIELYNGHFALSDNTGRVGLFKFPSGELISVLERKEQKSEKYDAARSVSALSPSKGLLLSISPYRTSASVFDVSNPQNPSFLTELDHDANLVFGAFLDESRVLTVSSEGGAWIWTLEDKPAKKRIPGHVGSATAAAFSKRTGRLAIGRSDGVVNIFPVEQSELRELFEKLFSDACSLSRSIKSPPDIRGICGSP